MHAATGLAEPHPTKRLVASGVWFFIVASVWTLGAFITLLSVTAEDAPRLWMTMGAFIPAALLALLFFCLAVWKRQAWFLAVTVVVPTLSVAFFWYEMGAGGGAR